MDKSQNIQKLAKLIEGIDIAMLTTVEDDGCLRSRPMATQQSEFDGDLWFFTGANSPKIRELEHDGHVCLSYSSPKDNRFVSISGKAEVVRDRAKAEELWKPAYRAWFPKGLEDPDLTLLKVTVQHAEYWDTASRAMVYIYGMMKSLTTGERPKGKELGEHEKLDMTGT